MAKLPNTYAIGAIDVRRLALPWQYLTRSQLPDDGQTLPGLCACTALQPIAPWANQIAKSL